VPKKKPDAGPLFKNMPQDVVSLAKQAAKGVRLQERADWWAANKDRVQTQ
jgi:hypothetical protein